VNLFYFLTQAVETTAKIAKGANKVLLPVAIAMDTVQAGMAVYDDVNHGTSRNTVESAISIAGGWVGGNAGAYGGAALGTAVFAGVGTIVGGIVGGVAGGIAGGLGASTVTDAIADAAEYDIVDAPRPCKKCGRRYKYRKYQRKDNGYCDECNNE
jgi:hypothetical protein